MNKLEELDALVKALRAGTAHLSLREIEEHWADAADALEAAMTTQKLSATKPAQDDNLYRLSVLVESDVLPDGLEVRRVVKAALQEFAALRRDAALLRAQAEENARLKALMPFARIGKQVADAWPEGSFELDGGELQDLLRSEGLIAAVPGGFNSNIHTDWNADCPAEGDEWLMPTALDQQARAALGSPPDA